MVYGLVRHKRSAMYRLPDKYGAVRCLGWLTKAWAVS